MKKVALTGASGHIGANLARALIDKGYKVVALVRQSSPGLDGLDVTKVQGDLLDQQSLCRAFQGVEQVYHLAAHISILPDEGEKLQSINVEGTRNVLHACRREGVSTLVYFSTIHALEQNPMNRAVNEKNPLISEPQSHGSAYDLSKAQAEVLVRENGCASLATRIIYPTGVIGPNDFHQSLIGQALCKMARGRLPALVSGGFDWVDARDVASGSIAAAEKGVDGDRFILSGHYRSMSEVANEIARLTGIAAPGFTSPAWLARLAAPVLERWARWRGQQPLYTRASLSALASNPSISHARATVKLAYQPRPFQQSIKDSLDFYTKLNSSQVNNDAG